MTIGTRQIQERLIQVGLLACLEAIVTLEVSLGMGVSAIGGRPQSMGTHTLLGYYFTTNLKFFIKLTTIISTGFLLAASGIKT